MKKLSFRELCEFEQMNNLWNLKFYGYPIWIHFREDLFANALPADRRLDLPSPCEMIKSAFLSLAFLFNQKKYKHIYMLMDREDLLQIYLKDPIREKILFLNREAASINYTGDYISSDFFNIFRFISRKITWLIFYSKYKKVWKILCGAGVENKYNKNLKVAMGDAFFLYTIKKFFQGDKKIFYSGCIVPIGEKFLNRLNSVEVQHGVIHGSHVGYIGIPKVRNELLLYGNNYLSLLKNFGYQGRISVLEYKEEWLKKTTSREYPIVFYTQPLPRMQMDLNKFLQRHKPSNFFIQRHPKDYFEYEISSRYFVKNTLPNEVKFPVFYNSSVIENFTTIGKTCHIIDYSKNRNDLIEILDIYQHGTESEYQFYNSIEEFYLRYFKHNE